MTHRDALVAVQRSSGEYAAGVPRLFALAGAEDVIGPGESVLIKPNLHAPQHWTTGGTTNPALVAALIEWARARGAGRIVVADSPFRGNPRPEETFTRTGMAAAVEQAGAEWTVLTRHPFRLFRDVSPHLPAELGISELVFELDRVINVAVLKTHLDCLVTLGMKNLKGCLRHEDKAAFHSDLDITRAIVALNRLVHPDFTLVDGTVGMEGIGPASGAPAHFSHIFAGRQTAAVDAVAASAMGIELDDALTLKVAREWGLLDWGRVQVVGEELRRIRRRFERPDEAMARELPGLRLQADGACSACKLNVIRALREDAAEGLPIPERLIVIGTRPAAEREALLIGRCARDQRAGRPYLPGCPPRLGQVKEFLAKGRETG